MRSANHPTRKAGVMMALLRKLEEIEVLLQAN